MGKNRDVGRSSPRAFPVAEFLEYLKYYEQQLESVRRSEEPELAEVVRGRLSARLASTLPQGLLRFDRDCPLRFEPEDQEASAAFVVLSVQCLPAPYRRAYRIRLYAGNALSGTTFPAFERMRQLRKTRDFTGELRLVYRDLQEGFVPDWRWQGENHLSYANGILEVLRQRYPEANEDALLSAEHRRANTATLLRRFAELSQDAAYMGRRDLAADFTMVFPTGTWFHFGPSCPLLVRESMRREAGSGFYRIALSMQCLSEFPELAQVEILFGPNSRGPDSGSLEGPIKLHAGERVQALLKFREISGGNAATGLQFRLVWDTIKEIRADEDRTRLAE